MDKIKDIFSPGHKQDSDTLYGSQQQTNPPARASPTGKLSGEGSHFPSHKNNDNTAEVASSGLASVGAAKGHGRSDTMDPRDANARDAPRDESQGFTEQSAKPGDSRYGRDQPAAAAAATSLPDRTADTARLTPATEKDTSHSHQTASPGRSNYDDQRYDENRAHEPAPTRYSQTTGLEPVGGVSRSSDRAHGIVGARSDTGNLRPSGYADGDDISVASVRSGVIGDTPHAKQLADSDLPVGTDHSSSHGRGIGQGTAAAAAAAGTAAAMGSDTGRAFPLSGGTQTYGDETRGDDPSRREMSPVGNTGGTSTTGMNQGTDGPEDSERAQAAAAGSTPFDLHKHRGRFHQYRGPNTDPSQGGPTFTPGPHATETGNRLDPSLPMPGAYPDSAAATPATEDPTSTTENLGSSTELPSREHEYGRDAAIAGAGAAMAGGLYETRSRGATGPGKETEAHTPHRASDRNDGRDDAIAGARAATAGALYEGRPRDAASTSPPVEGDRTLRISSQDYGRDTAILGSGASQSQHGEATGTSPTSKPTATGDSSDHDHHYGRDAAVAGAGAAAATGLYEAHRKGSTETDPATFTHGPHKSNVANIMDPRVLPDPNKMKGHQAQSTETDPASKTAGPHSSNLANVMDPRVLPQPEKMKQHTTAGPHQSDTLNRLDRKVDADPASEANQHHYGRDAAIAGGLGAGAAGAYVASHHQQEKKPSASEAVDPGQHSSSATSSAPARSSSTKGGWFAGPAGSAVNTKKSASPTSTRSTGPAGYNETPASQPSQKHHYGRDAAIAGGAGLAGAGIAHEYGDQRSAQPHGTSTAQSMGHGDGHNTASPRSAGGVGIGADEYQRAEAERAQRAHPYGSAVSTTDPASDRSRNLADPSAASTDSEAKHHYGRDAAAAGAAGLAGAGAVHEYNKHDAQEAEKERRKEQKELDKEEKKHEKELAKEQEKEEKKHEKELEKEEKKREKAMLKEEKKHDKEEKKKHRGGLLGFLHRDKDKDDDKSSSSLSSSDDDEKRHQHEKEAGGVAAGGAGVAAYEHEHRKNDRNRLHKDPPADYVRAHGGEHDAVKPADHQQEGVVIEPHTGLPMNVGKYGSGAGGTDGSDTIEGFHGQGAGGSGVGAGSTGRDVAAQGSAQGGNVGPDWENIRKANTPY